MIMGERVWDQRIRFLFVVAQMMGIDFFVWRSYWKGKNWWWEDFAKPLPFHPQTLEVTFTTFEGVTWTHHPQKGTNSQNCQIWCFFCEFSTLVFIMMVGKSCFTLLPSIARMLFRCKSGHMGAGWAEQLNAHEFIEPNVDTLKLTVWMGFSLEPTWKGCLFSNKIGQTIKIDVQNLLGQWLNGLNFLGLHI